MSATKQQLFARKSVADLNREHPLDDVYFEFDKAELRPEDKELLSRVGSRVQLASGDDALTLPMMSVGATGVISVTSNLYPRAVADLVKAVQDGRWEEARKLNFRLLAVHRAVFSEPSPGPIKAALSMRSEIQDSVRLPMVEATRTCRERLERVMEAFEGKK